MARVTPKTNWVAGNVPLGPDLNRMEGNAKQAFDEIDAEIQNRIDDVDAEEARAISAEAAAKEDALSSVSSAFGIGSYVFGQISNAPETTLSYGNTTTLTGGSNQIVVLYYDFISNNFFGSSGIITSGTWRCMGLGKSGSTVYGCLWVRIS